MNFTQYSELLSYPQLASAKSVMDIIGQSMDSDADIIMSLDELLIPIIPNDNKYDVMMFRSALRVLDEPFDYLSTLLAQLKSGGYIVLQDYVLPDNQRVADYINGFIHVFDKKHRKSFAQYEWDGLLLDVGLTIKATHHRSILNTFKAWVEHYQPDELAKQHAQIMLVQAPQMVTDTMQIGYAGTSFAEFVLQEHICIAQKA